METVAVSPERPSWSHFCTWTKEVQGVKEAEHAVLETFPAAQVARYKESITKYLGRRVVGIDVGTTHVGLAMVSMPCRRLHWACESLKKDLEETEGKKHAKFLPKDAPWYVSRLLERLVAKEWQADPKDTWIVIECQPMNAMQQVAACFKTWFHARGWTDKQVTMRVGTAKLSFLDTHVRYTADEVIAWMKIKSARPANKLASIAGARTVLEDSGDKQALDDIIRWQVERKAEGGHDDKADDATDALLYGWFELWSDCILSTHKSLMEEYTRMYTKKRQRDYYGMVKVDAPSKKGKK